MFRGVLNNNLFPPILNIKYASMFRPQNIVTVQPCLWEGYQITIINFYLPSQFTCFMSLAYYNSGGHFDHHVHADSQ